MNWNLEERKCRWSAGELASFKISPEGPYGGGLWRAEIGQLWHEKMRKSKAAESEEWKFEVQVEGLIEEGDWQFQIVGRMDQFLRQPDLLLIREIKTVRFPLPANEEELRTRYPSYFHQTTLYLFLITKSLQAEIENSFAMDVQTLPKAELVFVDINSGISQIISIVQEDFQALKTHLSFVAGFLEDRRSHHLDLREMSVPLPFESWRDGQLTARVELNSNLKTEKTVLFEAPTGFGKSGLLLESALQMIKDGKVEKVLVLTCKNTGHSPLIEQLKRFHEKGSRARFLAIRSRSDHIADPFDILKTDLSPSEENERWMASGYKPTDLFENGSVSMERFKELGLETGISPFRLSRMLLPYADIWVGDVNYIFDPSVSKVFFDLPGFEPQRTFLVIDEAHNLPERAALSRSFEFDQESVASVLSDLQMVRFPGKLQKRLDVFLSQLKRSSPSDALSPSDEADWREASLEISQLWMEAPVGADEISPESADWLWSLGAKVQMWAMERARFLCHVPKRGYLNVTCLDASQAIHKRLSLFPQKLLMSASLKPFSRFTSEIGHEPDEVTEITATAEWQHDAWFVISDARVDTRFNTRQRSLAITARTIAETADASGRCIAVFFPSFKYAEQVLQLCQFSFPHLRMEIQPRNLPLEEQFDFLESSLLTSNALFLIMGSRFSEGIDYLGGRISEAIIVSPGLPEPSAVLRAKAESLSQSTAFRELFIIPAMRKLHQSLGRLVRGPGHNASVLLHCQRFTETSYTAILPDILQPKEAILNQNDFYEKWIKRLPT